MDKFEISVYVRYINTDKICYIKLDKHLIVSLRRFIKILDTIKYVKCATIKVILLNYIILKKKTCHFIKKHSSNS